MFSIFRQGDNFSKRPRSESRIHSFPPPPPPPIRFQDESERSFKKRQDKYVWDRLRDEYLK